MKKVTTILLVAGVTLSGCRIWQPGKPKDVPRTVQARFSDSGPGILLEGSVMADRPVCIRGQDVLVQMRGQRRFFNVGSVLTDEIGHFEFQLDRPELVRVVLPETSACNAAVETVEPG